MELIIGILIKNIEKVFSFEEKLSLNKKHEALNILFIFCSSSLHQ